MPRIYVDADACPVKQEIYLVAARYRLPVTLVANQWLNVPEQGDVTMKVVSDGFDAADDWIAETVTTGDIVITSDIPLAGRCLERGAAVVGSTGRVFDEASIGDALAMRELMAGLREAGEVTGGPAPLSDRDRSAFSQTLDKLVHAALRQQRKDA